MDINWFVWGPLGFLVLLAFVALYLASFIVEQSEVVIVEHFGKFARLVNPGLHFKLPFIDTCSVGISIRLQQQTIIVNSKTKDNVTVGISVVLQFKVSDAKESWYALDNEQEQFEAFVRDAVRGIVPSQTVDDLFTNGSNIVAARVKEYLEERMNKYGYHLDGALVTEIAPDAGVLKAMNEINAAERMKAAATEKAEAEYIMAVRKAESEAESKKLQGKGMADQRLAIAEGLKKSIEALQSVAEDIDPKEIMSTIMLTQFLDTQKEIGTSPNTKIIFLPASPSALHETIMNGVLSSGGAKFD